MSEVKEALIRVGADENFDTGTKGSFALLGYTGEEKVVWLKQVAKPRGQGPAKIITFVITPEGAERIGEIDIFAMQTIHHPPSTIVVNTLYSTEYIPHCTNLISRLLLDILFFFCIFIEMDGIHVLRILSMYNVLVCELPNVLCLFPSRYTVANTESLNIVVVRCLLVSVSN